MADRPTMSPSPLASGRSIAAMQISAVVLCLAMNLMDGFDLLAMAFTAPAIASQWHLAPDRLGLLFSAGLAGMAAGALFLSPLADRAGRRPAILLCLILVVGGMLAAALATSPLWLAAARVVTGIGIGAIISSTGAMVYEFSSDRYRGLAMGLMAVCFPAGATLGGGVALLLMNGFGWSGVFVAGGVGTALLFPLVAWLMPESPSFLIQSDRRDRRDRGLAMIGAMGQPDTDRRDDVAAPLPSRMAQLAEPAIRRTVLGLGAMFLLVMLSFYFIINWAPKLVVQLGGPDRAGVTAGLLLNIGGMAGGLIAGLSIARFGLPVVTRTAIVAMAIAIAVFGIAAGHAGTLLWMTALLLGFTMFATQATIYMTLAASVPTRIRATVAGLVSTAGRVGSVLGPTTGGAMLAGGIRPALVCAALAVPAFLGALCVTSLLGRNGPSFGAVN